MLFRRLHVGFLIVPLAVLGCGTAPPPAKDRAESVKVSLENPEQTAKAVAMEVIKVPPMSEDEVMKKVVAALKVVSQPYGSGYAYASPESRAETDAWRDAAWKTLYELWPGEDSWVRELYPPFRDPDSILWNLYKKGPKAAEALPLVRYLRENGYRDRATATCLALDPTDAKSLEWCVEVINNAPKIESRIEYSYQRNHRVMYALWGIAAAGPRAKAVLPKILEIDASDCPYTCDAQKNAVRAIDPAAARRRWPND